ncbi:MAG: phosphonate C-P lyase system protein PhnG [Burkholderiales bacterium]|nr:phosphonate C-P lyase system protein PhnG [Burkholderiales bacterium]
MTPPDPGTVAEDVAPRQAWLSVLARAATAELEAGLARWAPSQRWSLLRRPEIGMVMLRGRIGGGGDAFNLGEATVTRCAVRLADGPVGSGHVLGRDARKAELVAVFDALMQVPAYRDRLAPGLIEPLRGVQGRQREAAAARAGASRVEFFTSVRGE